MRKLYLSLILPLLMLLAQQGAVWHEIGHLNGEDAPASSTEQQQDKKLPIDKLCATCLSFAQLGGAAKSEVPALNLLTFSFGLVQTAQASAITADAPALRNRGPPSFL
jgi:hypothetical protein